MIIQLGKRSAVDDPRATATGQRHFHHEEQQRFYRSDARFDAGCGGRRSGKSVIARAKLVKRALKAHLTHRHVADYKAIIGAPTRDQVKRLHWEPLKALIPRRLRADISEGALRLQVANGAVAQLVGFDRPERAEGEAIDDALLDEIADMKEEAWTLSVRPSLGTRGRPGRCQFIGKPRGRNHWWRIWSEAADKEGWGQFHWNAEDILDESEIAALKQDLDPISYDQEVRANFVNFSGRAYYAWFTEVHAREEFLLFYQKGSALDFTFDFNVEPGTAGVSQEQSWDVKTEFEQVWLGGEWVKPWIKGGFTALIDEVWIAKNSNTLAVAKELVRRWAPVHKGLVRLYGDATGGARKTSALDGNDWDIILREFRKVPHWRVVKKVPDSNPAERDRLNAVNARLMASDGRVRTMVNRLKCPHHVQDFEAVSLKNDGSGEIDKKSDKTLTHPSDGFGYKVHRIAPIRGARTRTRQV